MSGLGINGTLFLATQSLSAQREAIEVAGQNIANVNTPGYARQRAQLLTTNSIKTSLGQQGTGVAATNIQQIRSSTLDAQIPSNLSALAYYQEKSLLLGQVQTNLGQTLDRLNSLTETPTAIAGTGLSKELDAFYTAFQDLSANPTSIQLRQQVISAAQNVAGKLNTIGNNLANIQTEFTSQASQNVDDINTDLAAIADFNSKIGAAEVGGQRANDLRDARQKAVEDISNKLDLYTHEESDGTLTVRLGNASGPLLVQGKYSGNTASAGTVKLALDGSASSITIKSWTGGEAEIAGNLDVVNPQPSLGSLAADLEVVKSVIGDSTVGLVRDFNRIASGLAGLVNTQHAAGFTLEGPPAYATAGTASFFDDDSTAGNALGVITAQNIQLNSAVATDPLKIAASSIAAEPNNGSNATLIASLRTNTTGAGLGGISVSDYYLSTTGTLGNNLRTTNNQGSTQTLVSQQLNQQRDSVMGVSMDEEMSDLLRFQHAYQASARLISTVDEMIQTILAIK